MPIGQDVELRLNPRRALMTLMAFNTLLAALSLGALMGFKLLGTPQWLLQLYWAVNVDAEGNLPAIYSSLQLLVAAGLLGLVAVAHRQVVGGAPRRLAMIAALLVLMAADESFVLHERIGRYLPGQLRETGPIRGCFTWVYVGGPLALMIGAIFLPVVWKLHRATRFFVVLAAGLFVGGALGLETLAGLAQSWRGTGGAYYVITVAEEWCEMTGISVLLYAMMRELSACPAIRLTVASPAQTVPAPTLFTLSPA